MKRRSTFTIIELLLVISIAGLMLTVAVPAFSRMLKGSASGIAVRELMGKLNAARAYAVANKTYVAVVFPTDDDANLRKRHGYRSYRVCEVRTNSEQQFTFLRWIPRENWNFFPQGIILGYNVKKATTPRSTTEKPEGFEISDSDDEKKSASAKIHDGIALQNCAIAGRSFSENSAKSIKNYIIFRPDGTTDKFPNGILLRLRDGRTDNDGYPIPENKPTESAYYPLIIRFNGKVKFYNELVED